MPSVLRVEPITEDASWYENSRGRVITTSPWRLVDYWRWTREADLTDYHWT